MNQSTFERYLLIAKNSKRNLEKKWGRNKDIESLAYLREFSILVDKIEGVGHQLFEEFVQKLLSKRGLITEEMVVFSHYIESVEMNEGIMSEALFSMMVSRIKTACVLRAIDSILYIFDIEVLS